MACRNMKRADAARTKLLQWLDGRLEQRKERTREDGEYVRSFREGCDVLIEELDLANLSSVVRFAATMDRTYVCFN
jgi:3-keto steroid reductase